MTEERKRKHDSLMGSSSEPLPGKDEYPYECHVFNDGKDQRGTLIWLHGLGGEGEEFVEPLKEIVPENVKCIIPNAPIRPITMFQGQQCRAWTDRLPSTGPRIGRNMQHIHETVQKIHEIFRKELLVVPASRIVIGGFSQGGLISMHAGLSFEQEIGGIIMCSGSIAEPTNFNQFMFPREQSPYNANTPILVFHGTRDEVVKYEHTKEDMDILTSTFNIASEFVDLPRVPHSMIEEEWSMIQSWICDIFDGKKPDGFY